MVTSTNEGTACTFTELDLISASRKGQLPQVEHILEEFHHARHGPRWLNQFDSFGWAALHHAAYSGHTNICEALIYAGADVNLRTERAYETPLFLAAAVNHCKISQLLLQSNADPNIGDITGKIPLEVAYGKTKQILSNEQLKHGRIYRFLPTIRKLLASKVMQFLLQLLLCVILELFQESLLVSSETIS
jgi:ankyrin repeat protein